uniref:PH domain-containing protein n=1 Tax=Romanomermis culicivorax TaxID=13658 RepID=A0A915IZJ9_ROMCU
LCYHIFSKSVELEPRIIHKDSSFSNPQPLQFNIVDATLGDEMSNLSMKDSSNAISAKDFIAPLKKIEKLKSHSLTPQIEKCRKGHRKTMSLGSNVPKNLKRVINDFYNPNETLPVVLDSRRHLLDDSLLDCSLSCTAPSSTLSSSHINPIHENIEDSGNESEHKLCGRKNTAFKKNSSDHDVNDCTTALLLNSPGSECLCVSAQNGEKPAASCSRPRRLSRQSPGSALIFEGAVRKKTVMKNGVKKGEPTKGFVYKIRTGSEQKAKEWVNCLKLLIKNHQANAQPSNLMTFD